MAVAFAGWNRSMIVDAIDAASNTPSSKVVTRTKFWNGVLAMGNPEMSALARKN